MVAEKKLPLRRLIISFLLFNICISLVLASKVYKTFKMFVIKTESERSPCTEVGGCLELYTTYSTRLFTAEIYFLSQHSLLWRFQPELLFQFPFGNFSGFFPLPFWKRIAEDPELHSVLRIPENFRIPERGKFNSLLFKTLEILS